MGESIDIITEDDEVIRSAPREEVRKGALLFRSSHIIVSNSKGDFFVQKRSSAKDLWPDMYDVGVGETLKAGENYDEAARRGLIEEIGAEAEIKFLFELKFRSQKDNENCRVYSCCYDGELTFSDREVAEGFFVSKEKLPEMMKTKPFTPFSRMLEKRYFKKNE